VLLVPTRPPILSKPLVSSGTIIRILKLRRSLDAYMTNRLAIKAFRRRTFLLCLPSANPDPATRSNPLCIRIETLFQVNSDFSPALVMTPALNVLSIPVTWLTMPGSMMPTRSREAPQATLDHGRPPDPRRLEGRDASSSRRTGEWGERTSWLQ
jgi:hypothetical protein